MKKFNVKLGTLFGAATCSMMPLAAAAQTPDEHRTFNLTQPTPETMPESQRYRIITSDYKVRENFRLDRNMEILNGVYVEIDNPARIYTNLNDRLQLSFDYYRTRGARDGQIYTGDPKQQRRKEYTLGLRYRF